MLSKLLEKDFTGFFGAQRQSKKPGLSSYEAKVMQSLATF